MKEFDNLISAAIFLALALTATATWAADQASGFVSAIPTELKWSDAPAIGPGVKLAVIEGDMKSAGPFTIRIKFPPKTRVAVHTHPLVEHVTVLSGSFYFATGEKFEAAKAKVYPAGGFLAIPKGMPMFAFTKDKEATIQVHGIGPWGIDYLKAEDAPSKKK